MIKIMKNKGRLILCMSLSFAGYILSNGGQSIPVLAWIYPVLFLYMVDFQRSSKICFVIFGIYASGFVIRFFDVIGMEFWVCAVVAVLTAAVRTLPYLLWQKSKNDFRGTVVFAAAMVIVEYIIDILYPILGGLSDAYTQYRSPYLLQIVTVTGIYGITFVMYWTAAVILWLWNKRSGLAQVKKYMFLYCTVMGIVFLYGVVMFQMSPEPEKSVRIAAVTVPVSQLLNEDEDVSAVFYTDSFSDKNRRNARRKLAEVADELFRKTEQEAQADAKLVFWSELNGAVLKEDEDLLLQRASAVAKRQNIYLMVSLLVKTPYEDLKENKIVAFNPQGRQISEYYKYGRSIGELCQKGDGTLKTFDTAFGKISSAICSDMAFSDAMRQNGKNDVDILIVPASDWKEMKEIAIKTAIVRGVENGCNVIRHANRGMSVVSDAHGNLLAWSDYFQSDTQTMAAQVKTGRRFTVYPYIGNVFVYLCGAYLLCSNLYKLHKFLWGRYSNIY